MSWQHYAACQTEDPELFFPIGTTPAAMRQLHEAKQICARCPVRSLCLEWAMLASLDHGVWGGFSEEERRALASRNRRQRHADAARARADAPVSTQVQRSAR